MTFRTAWKNACKAAGYPGKLIHDMHRSAVRTFERAGVPRSVAMSIVGHKTESIYRRHAIVVSHGGPAFVAAAEPLVDAGHESLPSANGIKTGSVVRSQRGAFDVTAARAPHPPQGSDAFEARFSVFTFLIEPSEVF